MKSRIIAILLCGIPALSYSATLKTSPYTGVIPGFSTGTTVAAAYAFPVVVDTAGSGGTYQVISTGTGAVLMGDNQNYAVSSDWIGSGFVTNIELALASGETVTSQQIAIALAQNQFDDGFRIDFNGVTILDFDFGNYTANTDFQSAFFTTGDPTGFYWTPWTGEGNPELTLDATNGLQLMVTATANGTGALSGISTGTRFNALSFFTSNTYVSGPQTVDFTVSGGARLGIYNRNDRGAWSIPAATLTATAVVVPEPSQVSLLALGLGLLVMNRRRTIR